MLTSLGLALALASGQSAEPPAPHGGMEEHHVFVTSGHGPSRDADGDGFISRDEFMAPLAEAFARLDTDNDGRLSEDERGADRHEIRLREGGPGLMHGGGGSWIIERGGDGGEARSVVIGRDGDGPAGFTFERAPADGERRVEIVTSDGEHRVLAPRISRRGPAPDGETRTVVVEAHGDGPARVIVNGRPVEGEEAGVIVREFNGGPGGGQVFMRRPGGAGHATFEFDRNGGRHEVFVRRVGGPGHAGLDKDGDGKISEEEFVAPLREAFREMDADHSGAIEEGEDGPGRD